MVYTWYVLHGIHTRIYGSRIMKKLSETEMIKIIKDKKVSSCTDEEKKQIYVFAFGKEYMSQSDDMKGTLKTYKTVV